MTDAFELEDGVVGVLTKSGSRHPIAVPAGFTDLVFRNALACVYTLFIRNGQLPTVDDCFKFFPTIPKTTYSALFITSEFQQAMEYRGIQFDPAKGLTLEQQMALTKLADWTDTRSLKAKLEDLKVPMPRYQGWMKQPLFVELLNQQSREAYSEALPDIRRGIVGRAMTDQHTAEFVLAMTGEYDPQKRSLEDAYTVVRLVINSVLTRVKDPETRATILAEIKSAGVAYDVMHPRELEE